ncbi:hypothetical protein OIO90_003244 [Microbotryomycetes sp. JL221]|nr:hypothetical protein OIO90_003244 [Microbotryomycetes sp. JL221]
MSRQTPSYTMVDMSYDSLDSDHALESLTTQSSTIETHSQTYPRSTLFKMNEYPIRSQVEERYDDDDFHPTMLFLIAARFSPIIATLGLFITLCSFLILHFIDNTVSSCSIYSQQQQQIHSITIPFLTSIINSNSNSCHYSFNQSSTISTRTTMTHQKQLYWKIMSLIIGICWITSLLFERMDRIKIKQIHLFKRNRERSIQSFQPIQQQQQQQQQQNFNPYHSKRSRFGGLWRAVEIVDVVSGLLGVLALVASSFVNVFNVDQILITAFVVCVCISGILQIVEVERLFQTESHHSKISIDIHNGIGLKSSLLGFSLLTSWSSWIIFCFNQNLTTTNQSLTNMKLLSVSSALQWFSLFLVNAYFATLVLDLWPVSRHSQTLQLCSTSNRSSMRETSSHFSLGKTSNLNKILRIEEKLQARDAWLLARLSKRGTN